MRFHRLPRAREYMGNFWLPPLPSRDGPAKPGKKRDTVTGRFVKTTKREREKARRRQLARKRAKAALKRELRLNVKPRPPDRDTCYSIDCVECGRTWISAIRPIKPNTERGYVCDLCR